MKKGLYIMMFVIANLACKKPYNVKVATSPAGYLVVEGVINTGTDSTAIRLSRTVQLSSSIGSVPELGATVTIVSDAGDSYELTETGKGFYKAAGLNGSSTAKYGLKVVTAGNIAYQSDFVPVKNSPPIDSVYYKITSNGIKIYADTHDPLGNTRYYRWDFTDTYRFHSAFESVGYHAKIPYDTVLSRTASQYIYQCWRSDTSTTILINSSTKLTQDIISLNQLTFIPSAAEQIESRYSILVKQYALTANAFNYYQQLKKNTEQLGSIFDALPSELPGNIHCVTNPAERVLGYISAGRPSEQRIFIDNRDLPAWPASSPYSGCILDTALFCRGPGCENQVSDEIYMDYQIPILPLYVGHPPMLIGYSCSSPACVDCTLRGTTKRPSFWIDE